MAKKEATVVRIMVMLDCLLDTRLGTLAKLDPARAAKVLESGTYHTRTNDVFPGFTKEEFLNAYASRDLETLEFSTLTEGVRAVNDIVSQLRKQSVTHPYHDKIEVVVNHYPYELDQATRDEIGLAISSWITAAHSVKMAFLSYSDLTPAFCDEQYGGMFMYDYDNWWNCHTEAFRKKLIPNVYLWAPAIWFADQPSEETIEQYKKEGLPHPMQAIEMVAAVGVKLQLIDVRFFSIPDPAVSLPSAA